MKYLGLFFSLLVAASLLPAMTTDAEAKRLFEEAGVEDLNIKLIYNTSENHKAIATIKRYQE